MQQPNKNFHTNDTYPNKTHQDTTATAYSLPDQPYRPASEYYFSNDRYIALNIFYF